MRKTKIIIISIISIIILSVSSVFAFYMLKQNGIIGGTTGKIEYGKVVFNYQDNDTTKEINNSTIGFDEQYNTIKLYASEKNATDTENYLQSNCLIINIVIKTDIAVKVRVKIQDVWESQKTYSSGVVKTNTISRQWSEDNQVFTFNDGWTFDSNSGYAYYDKVIKGSSDEQTIKMLIPNSYLYKFETASVGYRETIFLTLGFNIDAVQANRADIIWEDK